MPSSNTGIRASLRRWPVLYGLIWAVVWALVGAVVVALWSQFGTLSSQRLAIAAYIVHCLAVVFGAVAASRCVSERGWYFGGFTGLVYALLMVVLSLLAYNAFSFDAAGLFRVLIMTLIGAFGGVIGMGLRRD
ncbi:MAG: TIGR04086 family membrane protein [Alicyclobacillus sp.]|nr:TIGR04086 family membrane protein [Alicyclobacillus sp.]